METAELEGLVGGWVGNKCCVAAMLIVSFVSPSPLASGGVPSSHKHLHVFLGIKAWATSFLSLALSA